jgi:thiamine-phosphate pyrophosphorylase
LKSYLITDLSFYDSLFSFQNYLGDIYQNFHIDFACYRDKNSLSLEYAKEFLFISKKYKIENILINSHIEVAKELKFNGVHLTSNQFDKIEEAKKAGLFVVISTHNKKEIEKAKLLKADAITFSPIFFTPNKGKPKGVEELKKAVEFSSPLKCFALGGIISDEQKEICKSAGAYGFASIRYFSVK